MTITFLLGGARSGKSSLAVRIAKSSGRPVVFVATATASDDEMDERIARHRAERPHDWTTLEEPRDLEGCLARAPAEACVLVDCLTLWVSTLLVSGEPDDEIAARSRAAAAIAAARTGPTIAVSNEVGASVVPDNALARRFRDVNGRVNAIWAGAADRAVLVAAGRIVVLDDADRLL